MFINRLKKNYLLLIFIFLFIYFLYNLLGGERGLISYNVKKDILDDLLLKESDFIKKIDDLKLKNSLLSNYIDLDYIEVLIRDKFIFGKKGEYIYILKSDEN